MKEQEQKQANQVVQPLAIQAREVGRMLGVSLRQVWRLNSAGKLPKPVRLGGSVRWRRDEIIAFVEAGCPDRQTWDAMKETLAGRQTA